MKTKTLRIIQEYFQPEIDRKIRIFSLGRKNSILNIYIYKECIIDILVGFKYLRTKCRHLQTVKGVLYSLMEFYVIHLKNSRGKNLIIVPL